MNLDDLTDLATQAGHIINDTDRESHEKSDGTPVTQADLSASKKIRETLLDETPYTYVDEEHGVTSRGTQKWWLVDPLDGTKDFMRGTTEYTVNIALIDGETPVIGVVHVPATKTTYAATDNSAWRDNEEITVENVAVEDAVVAVSKSHPDDDLDAFLQELPVAGRRGIGSSLKGCRVADNTVNLYPRMQSLHGWDVAAMHAVINGAGAVMQNWEGDQVTYSYDNKNVDPFVAGHPRLVSDVLDRAHD